MTASRIATMVGLEKRRNKAYDGTCFQYQNYFKFTVVKLTVDLFSVSVSKISDGFIHTMVTCGVGELGLVLFMIFPVLQVWFWFGFSGKRSPRIFIIFWFTGI
jgi:hypothetical protein